MDKNFIELIKKLLKDENRFLVEIIDLEKKIYVYSKKNLNDKWTGPPLFINKETHEYKFLFPADVINGHNELRKYNEAKFKNKG